MSATTFISWRSTYLVVCLFQGAVHMEIRTSKACYGSDGLSCTEHSIRCDSTKKIAIVDAYFTVNRNCKSAVSHCESVNPDNVTELGLSQRFDHNELISLYDKCSTKSQCRYKAPRLNAADTFSTVKYRCIEGDYITSIAEASQWTESDSTIIYKQADAKRNYSVYSCSIQSQAPVTIIALDLRLGDSNELKRCSTLLIAKKRYTCSGVIEPYQQLETVQSTDQLAITLEVKEDSQPVVWLGMTSTKSVSVKCSPEDLTPPGEGVKTPTESTTKGPQTTGLNTNRTSIITGATVGTFIFAAVVLVLLLFWRKRKVDEKPSQKIPRRTTLDGNGNTSHSAANSLQQGTYDEIDDLRQHLADNYDYAAGSNAYFVIETKEHSMVNNNGPDQEDEYNHLGQGLFPLSGTYDTTASVAKTVMRNNGSKQEDEYSHLRLGLSPMSGTYDTTASAAKSMEQADCSPADACYDHLRQPTATENISNAYDLTEKP